MKIIEDQQVAFKKMVMALPLVAWDTLQLKIWWKKGLKFEIFWKKLSKKEENRRQK